MGMTRDERQADAQLESQGWVKLAHFPDVIIWQDPSGIKYTISDKDRFPLAQK